MTLNDLIDQVRASIHDNDSLDYTDTQIISYINNGIRFVRRTIMAIDSMILATGATGTIEPNVTTGDTDSAASDDINNDSDTDTETTDKAVITLPGDATGVISVYVNGHLLKPINAREIVEPNKTGEPRSYYVMGFNTIHVYPLPDSKLDYAVQYVPDFVILQDETDTFPFPNEMIDFVVEYAVIRASMVNEFDVSQESSIMGSIISQMENLIRGYNGRGIQAEGYWNSYTERHDYGRRYW